VILNIRGTHGSGKSTVVKRLIEKYGGHELKHLDPKGREKVTGYAVSVPFLRKQVRVVGPYTTACGGCDAIQPYELIWQRVETFAKVGHVVFEGALVSSSYGNIGRASEPMGLSFVFAFMDTPLDVCLDRIRQRREARGDTRPLDPKNTISKYNNVEGSITKIRDVFNRRVEMIDHRNALGEVLALLLRGDREGV